MKNILSVTLIFVSTMIINLAFIPLYAQPSKAIKIAGNVIEPGSKKNITITIKAGKNDPATFIPLTVINGSQDGPVLATVAGVHGYEYTSILATEKWVEQLNAKKLTGTLLIVRLAHIYPWHFKMQSLAPENCHLSYFLMYLLYWEVYF